LRGERLPHPGAPPRRARFGVGEFPDAPGGDTVREALPGHAPLARISHTDYVLFTIEPAFLAIGRDVRPRRAQPCRGAGRAISPALQEGIRRRRFGRRKLIELFVIRP